MAIQPPPTSVGSADEDPNDFHDNPQGEVPDHHSLAHIRMAQEAVRHFPEIVEKYRDKNFDRPQLDGKKVIVLTGAVMILGSYLVSRKVRKGKLPSRKTLLGRLRAEDFSEALKSVTKRRVTRKKKREAKE